MIAPAGRARRLEHTLRAVGAVTRALHAAPPGEPDRRPRPVRHQLGRGVRRRAGHRDRRGRHRPRAAAPGGARRARRPVRYGRVVLLWRADPGDLLYSDELDAGAATRVEVAVTVDRADSGWGGHGRGRHRALDRAGSTRAGRRAAFVCGPEVMMRFTADALLGREVIPASRIRVSLERNMHCGVGWCGHCQLGPLLVCRDGPVVGYDRAAPLMSGAGAVMRRQADAGGVEVRLLRRLPAHAARLRGRAAGARRAGRRSRTSWRPPARFSRARTTCPWSRARSPRRTTSSGSGRSASSHGCW